MSAVFEIRNIRVDDIIPNTENFYSVDGIPELAANIKKNGLQQNIEVTQADEVGKYRLISGERRYRAVAYLKAHGYNDFSRITAKVVEKTNEASEIYALISANSYRDKSNADRLAEVSKLEEAVLDAREKNEDIAGIKASEINIQEFIAETLHMSKTQVGRYQQINNNLIPEFLEMLVNEHAPDNMTIAMNTAVEIAGMPEDSQREFYRHYAKGMLKITADRARRWKEVYESEDAAGNGKKSDQAAGSEENAEGIGHKTEEKERKISDSESENAENTAFLSSKSDKNVEESDEINAESEELQTDSDSEEELSENSVENYTSDTESSKDESAEGYQKGTSREPDGNLEKSDQAAGTDEGVMALTQSGLESIRKEARKEANKEASAYFFPDPIIKDPKREKKKMHISIDDISIAKMFDRARYFHIVKDNGYEAGDQLQFTCAYGPHLKDSIWVEITTVERHSIGLAAGWCIVGFKITAMHVEKKGQSNEE